MQLHITNHNVKNKLAGFQSLNTSSLKNNFCIKSRQNYKTICASCYAYTMEKRFSLMEKNFIDNSTILSGRLLTDFEIENLNLFNTLYFRLHSFGELINTMHYYNFIQICKYYSKTTFTLWTKRPEIIINLNFKKPENLILIYSSLYKNVRYAKNFLPVQFDKIFTVYNKAEVAKQGIKINCKQSCKDCLLCYTKNRTKYINELIH